MFRGLLIAFTFVAGGSLPVGVVRAAENDSPRIAAVIDPLVRTLMAKDQIAGMEVGVISAGSSHLYCYGEASIKGHLPVTPATLFEVGSISKTFTATLVALAQGAGRLALSDTIGSRVPLLKGSPIGSVTLLELGTHTQGGLPLQVPDGVETEKQLREYFRTWQPLYQPGTQRTYGNPGIGMLGLIAAQAMSDDFSRLVESRIFRPLGMESSYLKLPPRRLADYAQGYSKSGQPIRMRAAVVSDETYGVRTTGDDLLRFLSANLGLVTLDADLRRAIAATHTGYFRAGVMTQDLVWEQYPYPVTLPALLEGNSEEMIFNSTPVTPIAPPEAPDGEVWINKTGSTNGFGAYVAYVPSRRLGIVILANRAFPISERVTLAYRILSALPGPPVGR